MTFTYDPSIFEVRDLDDAKCVILNPDCRHSTDERWEIETDYLTDLLKQHLLRGAETCLDYGCGVGRLAKRIVEQSDARVLGVDISATMRELAPGYVGSERFLIGSPEALGRLVKWGLRFDAALAVWALQHCHEPLDHIARIHQALRPGGRFFVLNSIWRFVPVVDDDRAMHWLNDDVDIWAALEELFVPVIIEEMDKDLVPSPPSRWGVFEKR